MLLVLNSALGVAYLLGPSGYISFDGRPLPFSANCEYVLAADFVHKTFLITGKVNPNSNSRNPDMELKMEFRKQVFIFTKNEQYPMGKVNYTKFFEQVSFGSTYVVK